MLFERINAGSSAGSVYGDGEAHFALCVFNGHGQCDHAVDVFSCVVTRFVLPDLFELVFECVDVDDGAFCEFTQVDGAEVALAPGGFHVGEKQFAGCSAVQWQV